MTLKITMKMTLEITSTKKMITDVSFSKYNGALFLTT